MAGNTPPSGAVAAEKFALTLAGSLILHFALIFGLQIRALPVAPPSARILQARLVAPDVVKSQAVEPEREPDVLKLQVTDAMPPPPPSAPEEAAPPAPPASVEPPEENANLPSIEVPMIEDTTYYPAQEVDVHPSALQAILPKYPDQAARDSLTGSVVLLLLLDEGGKVQEASVEESDPSGLFDQSALEAFRHARFTPAQRHGRAVKSRVRIKVNYDLDGTKDSIDKAKQK